MLMKVVIIIANQFKIEWRQSPNYTRGRGGRKPIAIVNHITAGLMSGCLSWLCNPKAKASTHYLVTRKGEVFQLVKDDDTAWHAGFVNKPNWALYDGSNPNYYTLGIEHEALAGDGLTEAQYQATLELHRMLIDKHNIPIDNNHIIGHCNIDTVNRPNCPGAKFPWDRLFGDLRGSDKVSVEQALDILVKHKVINSPGYWLKAVGVVKHLDGLLINMAQVLNSRMVK